MVINGVIGAPKLLSIGHPHGIAIWLGPRVSRTFVALGTLALCALVLAFAGEEAQAQHMAIDEQVAGYISQTTIEVTPTEEASPRETRLARTYSVEPASQPALTEPGSAAEEPSPAASDPVLAGPDLPVEAALHDPELILGSNRGADPVSGSTTVPAEQEGLKTPVEPHLALPDPMPTTSELATEPAPGLVSVAPGDQETTSGPVDPDRSPLDLEPVAIEEGNPFSLLTDEAPTTDPDVLYAGEEGAYYVLGTSVVGAVETLGWTLESAAANALGILVDDALSWPAAVEGEGLIDTKLASLFYAEEAGHAPASELGEETKSSPTGAGPEGPLQDSAPQPVSPFTPPAGSSFSLSGGQVGAGVIALLLCVLASGQILLRREFELLWTFCELPKPSSVLLLPPERPG